MDRAIITWDPDVIRFSAVAKSRHPALRSSGYFAILAARLDEAADVWHDLELLFIGEAFGDRLVAQITKPRPAYERINGRMKSRPGKELIVMLGEQTGTTLKRVTRGFTDDVLRCLVVRHEPPCNEGFNAPYDGRKISVINRGDFRPLKPKCLLRPEI